MLNPYFEKIDIDRVMELQNTQFQQLLYAERSVPPNSQIDHAKNITAEGHFLLLSINIGFSTLVLDDQETIDDGRNHLFMQLVDLTHHKELFDDFVDLSLIGSPGRLRFPITGAGTPADSQPVRIEFPFVYMFPVNSVIGMRTRNDSDAANKLQVTFKGIRIYTSLRT